MTEPSFLIAFGVGFLSFLAPCTLPVLPGYFSYLARADREEDARKKQVKIFFTSLFFVLGFLLVLVILGATASFAGQFLLRNRSFWQKIGGLIIIIFGLQTMGFLELNFLQKGKSLGLERLTSWQKGKAFLAGSSFGIGWVPCIGPILGSILILASQTQTLTRGVGLLISYALGLSIPMLFSGFLLSKLKFLKNQRIPLVSGGILVVLGVLLFTNQYDKLTLWISGVYKVFKIPIF